MQSSAKTSSPVRRAFMLARVAVKTVLIGAGVVAVGYLFGATGLYRPNPDGPATNPITLVIIVWLGWGLLRVSPARKADGAARLLFLLAGGLAVIRLIQMLLFPQSMASWGPLSGSGAIGLQQVEDLGDTGFNSLLTALLIAAGQVLRARRPCVAFFFAALATVFPLVSVFGYSFGFEHFHGEMSPITAGLLLSLSLVGGLIFVRRPVLRPLFSDTRFGRGARMEILAGIGFPWLLGGILAYRTVSEAPDMALQSALMSMFAVTVVVVKTRAHALTEMERQRTVRALQAAAGTDHLTGLANRHEAMQRIDALATTRPVAVIVIDLDHFKTINDSRGHATGDRVLVDVSRLFKQAVAASGGIVARWGGEEFLVVLPGHDLDSALAVAERLRAGVANLPGPDGTPGGVTASFGVADRLDKELTLDAAMHRADVALYQAKESGRDRVMQSGRPANKEGPETNVSLGNFGENHGAVA